MKKLVLAALLVFAVSPLLAQSPPPPEPVPPPPPPTTPAPAPVTPPPPPPPEKSFKQRLFFGGGVGASFGTIDYVEVAPMVGMHVIPRIDVGVQPFYRWTDDGRYSPSVNTNDYGASIFGRVIIFRGLFGQVGYEYANYEYPLLNGGTKRDTYNAFLAGGGWFMPIGGKAGMYFSALYDFNYDDNDPIRAYDSPWRYSVGVSVGF